MTQIEDILDRIARLENLIIVDLVFTAAIVGEKAIELVLQVFS
jgi:hypothetical protein